MRKCIFCHNKADSKEHLWSKWILDLLPEDKNSLFTKRLPDGTEKSWRISKPEQTAGLVCERACNNGWMSTKLEAPMQKIASDIIVKHTRKTFSPSDCATIAAWSFKSALLAAYMSPRHNKPFFSEAQCHTFARNLWIPAGVNMWIAKRNADGYLTANFVSTRRIQQPRGPLTPHLITPPASSPYRFEVYDFIFSIGYLLLQVTATRWTEREISDLFDPPTIAQPEIFTHHATQIWPSSGPISWPPPLAIGNDIFDRFCSRFSTINLPNWMV